MHTFEPMSFSVQGVPIGGGRFTIIAGPCAVESYQLLRQTAQTIKEAGAAILRGGAYKPRTSPKSFQGLGEKGIEILSQVGHEFGLPVVTEVTDPRHITRMLDKIDIFQIGSRNMHNYALLAEVGRAGKPVLLKRGIAATEKEFLLAADYILEAGEKRIILCERGIRGVNETTRNILDLAVIAALRSLTNLPIFVDPSHATGRSDLVPTMMKAAVPAGADGLMVEVHPEPENALCDGKQALLPAQFQKTVRELRQYVELEGKVFAAEEIEVKP